MTSYTTRDSDGNRVMVRLYSLDEYEADGGIYFDGGNGGEAVCKDGFLCAAAAFEVEDGALGCRLDQADAVRLLGVPGAWCDSVTGYILLPDWPEGAPLEARMVEGASTAGPR